MKAKKWVTIITFVCSMGSLVFALVAKCKCYDLMYDLSMAAFGSALLGFIMSLTEYFSERRKAMETFLSESYKIYTRFRKIKYIDIDESSELLVECIVEEQNNQFCDKYGEETARFYNLAVSHKKRDEYFELLERNSPYFTENDDIEAVLTKIYKDTIENYKALFKSRMNMYMEFNEINLGPLSDAYGNLDFIFANKKIRNVAYDSIYKIFLGYQDEILKKFVNFNAFANGKGNFVICVRDLLELNNIFFTVKKQGSNEDEITLVYAESMDNIADRLTDFQAKTYFKRNVKYTERRPVLQKVKNHSRVKEESAF